MAVASGDFGSSLSTRYYAQEHNQLINSRHKIQEGELEIFNNDIPHHPHLFSIFRPSNGISLLFFIKHVNNGIILISFY